MTTRRLLEAAATIVQLFHLLFLSDSVVFPVKRIKRYYKYT